MIELASARTTSSSSPAAFYARWIDHSTWTRWDTDTEWVRLDGPVAVGTKGVLKSEGGPEVRFTITSLDPDREYVDTSRFFGARLTFLHRAELRGDHTELLAQATIEGPLAWLWHRILGDGFATSVPEALNRLVRLVESQS